MLQELTQATGAQGFAIASMLFFLAVFLGIAWHLWRTRRESYETQARLPLEDEAPPPAEATTTDDASQAASPRDEEG